MDFPEESSGAEGPLSADRRKDAFVLAVAHDLRASLSALAGSLAVLREHAGDLTSTQSTAVLDVMSGAVANAELVISDLFAVERLEHGVASVVRAPTDLAGLVERVVATSGAGDRIDVDVDDAVVEVDAGLTERILANLVTNAVEHAGSTACVVVRARARDDHVLVQVDDTGPGMPAEERRAVFEPFRGASGHGTGVGLHLVREFARFHGGDAWIEDLPDGGTSVRVRLSTR